MMKKVFVRYPGLRSSTLARRRGDQVNYRDPCVDEKGKIACSHCKAFVISDRFLGEEQQARFAGSTRRFPYVIIVDTAGCNLRCWFCYSHHYWTVDRAAQKGCQPAFLSSEEITNQIKCKIQRIKSFEGKMDRKPFMRIRVSGGEPVFASPDTVSPYPSDKKVDYKIGIDFWMEFFAKLDIVIGELEENRELTIVREDDWNPSGSPWPSFIADSPHRVNIRFDTNGITFRDPEIADYLIDRLYQLYQSGQLNHLKVWIDYSFKGATPAEYDWSQKQHLPTTEDNNQVNYELREHPQYAGLKNLRDAIQRIRDHDRTFAGVADITVEKGIDHDREHRIFVYNPQAFHWDTLAQKAGISFSPVRNDMSVVYTYGGGPWGLFKSGKALLSRYFSRGAALTLFSNHDKVSLSSQDDDAVSRALNFMDRHNREENYYGILSLEKMDVSKEGSKSITPAYGEKPKSPKSDIQVQGWVLSGSPSNWIIALSQNMWGAPAKYREEWENLLEEGQSLFFYATRPVSGIIGYGKVKEKIMGKEPLWPDEVEMNRVKYPYRWSFRPVFVLPQEQWSLKAISFKNRNIPFYGGMNALNNKEYLVRLSNLINEHWNREL